MDLRHRRKLSVHIRSAKHVVDQKSNKQLENGTSETSGEEVKQDLSEGKDAASHKAESNGEDPQVEIISDIWAYKRGQAVFPSSR